MATREVLAAGKETLRNQMHPWYGIGMPILFVLAIGFGSRMFGRRFQYFSYATILAMVVWHTRGRTDQCSDRKWADAMAGG